MKLTRRSICTSLLLLTAHLLVILGIASGQSAPTIASISPSYGSVGTQVTISGSGFGDSPGTASVNWTPGQIQSWSDTQVVMTVAVGTTSGGVRINSGGVYSNAVNFTMPNPQIASITPTSGAAGTQITIDGSGFGAAAGSASVNWTPAQVQSWSDSEVVITVAAGTTSGGVRINNGGVYSNAVNFTLPNPQVASITPTSGAVGTQITIDGSGFGSIAGSASVNWTPAQVQSWSDNEVVITVAASTTSGGVRINNGGVYSNAVDFALPNPQIASITPLSGAAGAQITITGTGFGVSAGTANVNWTPAQVQSWSDTQVVITLGAGTTSGGVRVNNGGVYSNAVNFSVDSGYLNGSFQMTPFSNPPQYATINLSAPEALDWVHWGLSGATSVDRMSGANLISGLSIIGPDSPVQYTSCFDDFSWNNGDVNPNIADACSGLYLWNQGDGFQITVPADTTPKTLKLYVGADGATATLQASLSDNSAPVFTDSSMVTDGDAAGTYTIDFQAASPGQTLTVTYTFSQFDWGDVTIEAAELTPKHPDVAIVQPAADQVFSSPASFTASVQASQEAATISNVSLLQDGASVLTLNNTPFNFSVSSLAAGNFNFTAQATDSNGLTQTSQPVPVHVVGSGGELAASVAAPPTSVDLTTQGTSDWLLLGRVDGFDIDRKANVRALISAPTQVDWAYWYGYADNAITYSAEDGTQQFSPSSSGVYSPNPGSGFEFTVYAGLTERTVNVYLGAYRAQGQFQAYLSDGSAAPYFDSSTDSGAQNVSNQVYSLKYHAASEGQTLTIRYTLLNNHNYGNVTLQAVTVDGQPGPFVSSIFPPGGGVGIPIGIGGSHFGAAQGANSFVTIDGLSAPVTSWSDTGIKVTVPAISDSGSLIVIANGIPSNPVPFTFVLAARAASQSVYVSPDEITIEVGQQRLLKLVDQQGTTVTDVTWTVDKTDLAQVVPSSDSGSTDQFLEAIQPGKVTLTATSSEGTAQAIATIYAAGATPSGTAIYSIYPDNYFNSLSLPIKAIQNAPGDPYNYVLEYYGDASAFGVKALDENGQQIWRTTFPGPQINPYYQLGTPDGGLLIFVDWADGTNHLVKVGTDGTQQWIQDASTLDTNIAVGYDGTIYSHQMSTDNSNDAIVVSDSSTGTPRYQVSPPVSTTSTVSNEPADDPHPCKPFIPDSTQSGPGSFNLAGKVSLVVAANGHAYVLQSTQISTFSYTTCQYIQTDNGLYEMTSASGTLNSSAQLQLQELTPSGPGGVTIVASNNYNGPAQFSGGGLEAPDGTPLGLNHMPVAIAPDGDGGVLILESQLINGADQGTLHRVINNNLQYSVPAGGYAIAIGENGAAFIQQGYNSGIQALNIADGTPLWSTTSGRVVAATDDGGVVMQQEAADLSSSTIYQLDQTGAPASPSYPLPGIHTQYDDGGAGALVYSSAFGSVANVLLAQIIAPSSETYPILEYGNSSNMRAANGTRVTQFIDQNELTGCTGLDQSMNLSAVMVPIGGAYNSTNKVNLRIPKGLNATLLPYDANKVSVAPTAPQNDGNSHPITLTGSQPGSTKIGLFANDGHLIGNVLQVDVKPALTFSAYTVGITESAENLGSGTIPNAADLSNYWGEVFGRQANITITVNSLGNLPVHYDIQEHDFKLHHILHELYSNNLEASAINTAIDVAFPGLRDGTNLFAAFVTDIQAPTTEGFSVTGNHSQPSFIRDRNLTGSKKWITTHEFGHNIGAPHSTRQGTLMFATDPGNNPCRIGKETWDALNPVQ